MLFFPMKRGGEELKPVPFAYIRNFVAKVEELLNWKMRLLS